VFVGGNPLRNLDIVNSTTLRGTTRGGTPGIKAVTVRDPRGSATLSSAFTYAKP